MLTDFDYQCWNSKVGYMFSKGHWIARTRSICCWQVLTITAQHLSDHFLSADGWRRRGCDNMFVSQARLTPNTFFRGTPSCVPLCKDNTKYPVVRPRDLGLGQHWIQWCERPTFLYFIFLRTIFCRIFSNRQTSYISGDSAALVWNRSDWSSKMEVYKLLL